MPKFRVYVTFISILFRISYMDEFINLKMQRQDFLQFISVRKGLAPNSVRLCLGKYDKIVEYLRDNEKDLSKESVESFIFSLQQKGLRNNSINSYIFALKYIQEYLTDRGSTVEWSNLAMMPKQKAAIIILSPQEIELIIESKHTYGRYKRMPAEYTTQYLNSLYNDFTMFLAYTGCRFEEASKLKIKYLDEGKATFIETKNKEIRHAYFTEPLISRLKERVKGRSPEEYVFVSLTGSFMHPTTYIDDLHLRAKQVGITKRVHPHLFRHSYATQLLMSGVDVTMVASILGHKDIQTTFDNYVHLADSTLKKASFRHPLLRKNIDPRELIAQMREMVQSFKLDDDPRLGYKIEEGGNSLSFNVYIK